MQQAMNSVPHGKSTPLEARSCCCHAARKGLPCRLTLVVRNEIQPTEMSGFKRRATAVLHGKSTICGKCLRKSMPTQQSQAKPLYPRLVHKQYWLKNILKETWVASSHKLLFLRTCSVYSTCEERSGTGRGYQGRPLWLQFSGELVHTN